MKSFHVAITVSTLTLLLLGSSGCAQHATQGRSSAMKPLSEKDILAKARSEMAKLGVTPPDEDMMTALDKLGYKPEVSRFNDGWKVAHPLGHPWVISWIHIDMDSNGRVLRHQVRPGE